MPPSEQKQRAVEWRTSEVMSISRAVQQLLNAVQPSGSTQPASESSANGR